MTCLGAMDHRDALSPLGLELISYIEKCSMSSLVPRMVQGDASSPFFSSAALYNYEPCFEKRVLSAFAVRAG